MKMKKLTAVVIMPVATVAILALAILLLLKPHDRPGHSKGSSWGSEEIAVAPEALIQTLQKNDFEIIEGTNFQQILPADTPYRGYEGLVALRDTTSTIPNEFVVGVGPDMVMWFRSQDITGDDAIVKWESHVQKRIALVERLSANKQ